LHGQGAKSNAGIKATADVVQYKDTSEERYAYKELILYPNKFTYKGTRFEYGQITGVYFLSEQQKTYSNYSTLPSSSQYSTLKIRINPDKVFTLHGGTSGNLNLLFPSFFKDKAFDVTKAYKIVNKRSFDSRLQNYMRPLKNHGYLVYDDTVEVYSDGTVKKGNTKVRLKVAKQKDLVKVGVSKQLFGLLTTEKKGPFLHHSEVPIGGYKFNPYEIVLSEKGFGIFDEKISFKCYWDTEIILFIISELASGQL